MKWQRNLGPTSDMSQVLEVERRELERNVKILGRGWGCCRTTTGTGSDKL